MKKKKKKQPSQFWIKSANFVVSYLKLRVGSLLSNSAAALKIAAPTLNAGTWGGRMDLILQRILFGFSGGRPIQERCLYFSWLGACLLLGHSPGHMV